MMNYRLFFSKWLILLGIIIGNTSAMEAPSPMILLESKQEGKDPFVISIPQDVAFQSPHLKEIIENFNEKSERKITFTLISPETLQDLVNLLKALHKHSDLKGKKLLDALQKSMPGINESWLSWASSFVTKRQTTAPQRIISLFKAVDLLNIKPGIELLARMIVSDPSLKKTIENLIQTNQVDHNAAVELARYYRLLGPKMPYTSERDSKSARLSVVPLKYYSFSIQDYLDYQPQYFRSYSVNRVFQIEIPYLQISSLDGLLNIPGISSIDSLVLSNNHLDQLTEDDFKLLSKITNLQNIVLSNNQITKIADNINLLSRLTSIDLSSNQISLIPNSIGTLLHLRNLYLSNNQITEIPSGICNIQNLEALWLSNNQISKIPDCIGLLQNLKQLFLQKNQITQVPIALSNLILLQDLYLYDNQIKEIDTQIINALAPHLTNLAIDNNKLTNTNRQAILNSFPRASV